jgi:hypothetical protein
MQCSGTFPDESVVKTYQILSFGTSDRCIRPLQGCCFGRFPLPHSRLSAIRRLG